KRLPFTKSVELIFKISVYANVLAVLLMYFTASAQTLSRLFVAANWLLGFGYLAISRYFTKRMLVKYGFWQKPIIIIGAGKTAELLANRFSKEPGLGYVIAGLVEDNCAKRPLVKQYPCLGGFSEVEQVILESSVKDIIIAVPGLERNQLIDLVYRIQPYVKNVTIIPDLFGVPLSNMEVETLFNEKTVMLKVRNNLSSVRNKIFKRVFDFVVGLAIFTVISPVLLILMVIVKFDSKGPVLFSGNRLGKNGEEFVCYKFRTMYENSDGLLENYLAQHSDAKEDWTKFAKLKNYDPRVTKAGTWLRKYSLDELPQIFNVLLGEMSLVGPRPYLPRELERMGYQANTILETVPGITGLWQVSGRNEIEFEGRLQIDSWYVRNWSIWHDIVILFKTVGVVLGRKGAY
ncbi:MAG: Undecaprenyl-phosphate galactose phosphotransferase, WbaP, partial [Firmicutes bacterium]|nr:Undecaprenyl-phosphate galactose phosphotransferase, WbaP [Bacillota bacterium]